MPSLNTMIALMFAVIVSTIAAIYLIVKLGQAKGWTTDRVVKFATLAIFVSYVATLFIVTVVARDKRPDQTPRFIPFFDVYFIIANKYRWYVDDLLLLDAINAALFVPYGLLACETLNRKSIVLPLCSGVALSLVIEVVQLISDRGIFDVNDIIYNTLGTFIGCGVYALLQKLWYRILSKRAQSSEDIK